MVSQIFAISENDVIGKDNKLPWQLPNDLKYFKAMTLGHPVIMGRKTFESLGKPLKDRLNIIISSNKNYKVNGCVIVHGIEEAITIAKGSDPQEIFIIGGASVFKDSLPYTDKIYITEVKGEVDGDIRYHFDKSQWREIKRELHHKDEKHAYEYAFVEMLRDDKDMF